MGSFPRAERLHLMVGARVQIAVTQFDQDNRRWMPSGRFPSEHRWLAPIIGAGSPDVNRQSLMDLYPVEGAAVVIKNKERFARHIYSTFAPFRDSPAAMCRAVRIDPCDWVFEEESICTVIATAGIRYANVTQTHISAPAHSWS